MDTVSLLVSLLLVLTIIGGYKFMAWLYRNDPLFGVLFGTVLALGVTLIFRPLILLLGVVIVSFPIAYGTVLIYKYWRNRQPASQDYPGDQREPAPQQSSGLVSTVRTTVTDAGGRGLNIFRYIGDQIRDSRDRVANRRLGESATSQRQEAIERHGAMIITCVHCGAAVLIDAGPDSCTECGQDPLRNNP